MGRRRRGGRRYRLRSKARFCFAVLTLIACAVAVALTAGPLRAALETMGRSAKPPQREPLTARLGGGSPTSTPADEEQGWGDRVQAALPPATGAVPRDGDWRLTLVNGTHPLPAGFQVRVRQLPNGLSIDTRVYDDLMRMIGDGEAQGLSFVICSAYRSIDKQEELFAQQVSVEQGNGCGYEEACNVAQTKVALPGTSEHNLGLAADIVALNYQKLDEGYLETPECKWLASHCSNYGFIMRYPQGKCEITKIIFEPWHYRYVGREAAKEIMDRGICLEEYLGEVD